MNGCKVNQFKNAITSLHADVSGVDQGRDGSRSQAPLESDFCLRIYVCIYIYIYMVCRQNAESFNVNLGGMSSKDCHLKVKRS